MSNREIFTKLAKVRDRVIVELGCGPNKQCPDAIGVDRLALAGVDIVHDLETGLMFIPDDSVDEITSSHFLEHVQNFEFLMKEIHRVLKKDGIQKVTVPHFTNPGYYSDFTHKRFFGLYTFDYFTPLSRQNLGRKVPDFYVDFHFIVTHRRFNFKKIASPRNLMNRLVYSPLFNSSDYFKELYEDKFCFLFPCQELYFEMKPIK